MRVVPIGLVLVAAAAAACSETPPPRATPPTPRVADTSTAPSAAPLPSAAPSATPPVAKGPDPNAVIKRFRAAAERTEELSDDRTVLCNGEACVCFAPLTCTATGDCVKYDANLAGFKEALARKQGRIVTCESASVSSCGEFRGFDFNGDIHRHELRWFAEDGTLVAQRNVTDYPEYCDGKARVRVLGRLPECGEAQLSETLCGDKPQAVRTPEDDVGRFLKPPAAPGD